MHVDFPVAILVEFRKHFLQTLLVLEGQFVQIMRGVSGKGVVGAQFLRFCFLMRGHRDDDVGFWG